MSAYIVVDITVHDTERYMEYVDAAPDFVTRHQGKYLVRGGATDVMEGDWRPERLVVLEFPSREHARALLEDPEYQAIAPMRKSATTSNLLIVDGV